MATDPIEQLVLEHRVVEAILATIEQELGGTASVPTPEALAIIRSRVDHLWVEFYHHSLQREERLLFPRLGDLAPPGTGPVAVMEQEHRLMVEDFNTILTPSSDVAEVSRAAATLCATLRLHMIKENTILFPMAREALTRDQQRGLAEQFADYDSALGSSPPTAPRCALWREQQAPKVG